MNEKFNEWSDIDVDEGSCGERLRFKKFTKLTCPHCGKETKGAGFYMTRAYCLQKFLGMSTAQISTEMKVSQRYVRELLAEMINS